MWGSPGSEVEESRAESGRGSNPLRSLGKEQSSPQALGRFRVCDGVEGTWGQLCCVSGSHTVSCLWVRPHFKPVDSGIPRGSPLPSQHCCLSRGNAVSQWNLLENPRCSGCVLSSLKELCALCLLAVALRMLPVSSLCCSVPPAAPWHYSGFICSSPGSVGQVLSLLPRHS